MKYFLVFFCVILAVFAYDPDAECNIEGHVIGVGEKLALSGKCKEFECVGPNAFSSKTCSKVVTKQFCKYIPQDNSKPYPDCCPRHEC